MQTTHYGIDSISNWTISMKDLLPDQTTNASLLFIFKNKIKKWMPEKYP